MALVAGKLSDVAGLQGLFNLGFLYGFLTAAGSGGGLWIEWNRKEKDLEKSCLCTPDASGPYAESLGHFSITHFSNDRIPKGRLAAIACL